MAEPQEGSWGSLGASAGTFSYFVTNIYLMDIILHTANDKLLCFNKS